MAQRITRSFLNDQVINLNRILGFTNELYTYDENFDLTGGVEGVYFISDAHGGYALHRMHQSTEESDVFNSGHISARKLSKLIDAYMREVQGI